MQVRWDWGVIMDVTDSYEEDNSDSRQDFIKDSHSTPDAET